MDVRKTVPVLMLAAAFAFGGAACGDKTVTSAPPATQAPVDGSHEQASLDTSAADADLTQVDQLLRDIESDLNAVDQDAATPEGDPAQ
ncbi:MAG: hypothetical protein QOG90_1297 [Actinomycetota bacterium]